MTVREWINSLVINQEARDQYCDALSTVLCVDASEVSLLAWLKYCQSGDNVQRLIETENGAQERKFIGGSCKISQSMANELNKDIGDNTVRLNHVVKSIRQYPDFVEIVARVEKNENDSNNNQDAKSQDVNVTLKARYLICAIPPTLYSLVVSLFCYFGLFFGFCLLLSFI